MARIQNRAVRTSQATHSGGHTAAASTAARVVDLGTPISRAMYCVYFFSEGLPPPLGRPGRIAAAMSSGAQISAP